MSEPDFDSQDQAEAFDESMTVGDEEVARDGEIRTFEELPEVEDLTQLIGDRDDDEGLALDADAFDEEAVDDADLEEDDELDFHAATAEREDDIDGLGPEDGFDEARIASDDIEGQDQLGDAQTVEGGEDDVTDFQSAALDDDDLLDLGYARKP